MVRGQLVYVKTLKKKGIIQYVNNGGKSARVLVDDEILTIPMRALRLWSDISWFVKLFINIFR